MKTLFFTLIVLLSWSCVWAQDEQQQNFEPDSVVSEIVTQTENQTEKNFYADSFKEKTDDDKPEFLRDQISPFAAEQLKNFPDVKRKIEPDDEKKFGKHKEVGEAGVQGKEKFHWKASLVQSVMFLALQQGYRITLQDKTRRQLGGPFFREWFESVKTLRGWDDGNKFFTNYIAHPLQGGATGRIFIHNSENAGIQEFGKSKDYWKSRFKTAIWSTVWSTQFELGPISEASLGNVGKFTSNNENRLSWIDLVITPTAGTGIVIAEDAIDKYILKNWIEKDVTHRLPNVIKFLRTLLTPTTSFANLLRGKLPWVRDYRAN